MLTLTKTFVNVD